MIQKMLSATYLRNFVFGVEDSLVSTVGLLSGIALADVPRETIFITGVILILTEAVSMAGGSFLSESSAEEYVSHSEKLSRSNFIAGGIMFFSYLLAGLIPLSAYLFWPVSIALKASVLFALVTLFFLGILGARIAGTNILKNSTRMVIVGGLAIALGSLAGVLLSHITPL